MGSLLKTYVDYRLRESSPLKIILITSAAAYSVGRLQSFLSDDEFS